MQQIAEAAKAGDADKIQQLVDQAAPLEQEGDDIAANIALQVCSSDGA